MATVVSNASPSILLVAIATGYGRVTMSEFAEACKAALSQTPRGIKELRFVLREEDNADLIDRVLAREGAGS